MKFISARNLTLPVVRESGKPPVQMALRLCAPPSVGVDGAAEMPFISREFVKLVAAAKGKAVRVKCNVNFLWLDGARLATGSKTIRRSAINDIKNHYLSEGGPLPEKFRQIVVLAKMEDLDKPWVRQSSDEAFIAFAEVLEEAIKNLLHRCRTKKDFIGFYVFS